MEEFGFIDCELYLSFYFRIILFSEQKHTDKNKTRDTFLLNINNFKK